MAELGLRFDPARIAENVQRRAEALEGTVQKHSVNNPQSGSSETFLDTLKNAVNVVNESQLEAEKASVDFAAGKGQTLHGVMIAMEKADLSLRTLVQVRNKVLEAYQEVMKMPV